MIRQPFWLVALGLLLAACNRTQPAATGLNRSATPRPPIKAIQPSLESKSDWTSGNSPSRFHSVQLPKDLETLVKSRRNPTPEDVDHARAVQTQVLADDSILTGYFRDIAGKPGLAKSADLNALVENLVSLSITRSKLKTITAPWDHEASSYSNLTAWSTAGTLLRSPTDPATSALVTQTFQGVARRLAASAKECDALDQALLKFLRNVQLDSANVPVEFRFEFAIARFEAGASSCQVLPQKELSDLAEGQRARLAALVGDESRSRATAEMAFAYREDCRSHKPAAAISGLGICPWAVGAIGASSPDDAHEPLLKPGTRNVFAHNTIETRSTSSRQALTLAPFLTKVASNGPGNLVGRVLDQLADSPAREYWVKPDRSTLVLTEQGNQQPGEQGTYVFIVTNSSFKIAPVPISFGQYDDDQIVGVTDADGDGNIEIWIQSSVGECDEEDDVKPGVNCAVSSYHRLEQFGDNFIPFVDGPRPKQTPE